MAPAAKPNAKVKATNRGILSRSHRSFLANPGQNKIRFQNHQLGKPMRDFLQR